MKRRREKSWRRLLWLSSVVLLIVPTSVWGQGSIAFNGFYSANATGGSSKLENTSANVLNSATQLTVCFWIYVEGSGENNTGDVFVLDEQVGNAVFLITRSSTPNSLTILKSPGAAGQTGLWTIPIVDGTWNAVSISLNFTTDANPTAQVNFNTVTPSTVVAPVGIQDLPADGYCVGNRGNQTATFNGRIAHLQFFNTILSAGDAEATLRIPGSVTSGRRLYLRMSKASDTSDHSGNGFHGTGTDLADGSNFAPVTSMLHFAAGAYTIDHSLVIASNGDEPAGGVVGQGDRTKLTAGSSLTSGARFITTEGYGDSSVVEPTVKDLYLFGDQDIPIHPFVDEEELELEDPVCHAIALDGDAPTVSGCKIFDFRGDAIAVGNTTDEISRMIRIPRVTNNKISHCWTGINAGGVDAQIDGNRIASVRDYGIIDPVGSIQCSNNHVFGARWGIYFTGGPSRSIGDRFSDCATGFFVDTDASGSDIVGGTTEHCGAKNMDIRGERVHIADTRIFVANSSDQNPAIIGCDLHFSGSRAVMADCELAFPNYTINSMTATGVTGSTGVYVQQHNARIENLQLTGSAQAGETGVRILNDRNGIYVFVTSAGNGSNFNDDAGGGVNDELVRFDTDADTNTTSGIVYVVYESGEVPVRIDNTWTSALKIYTRLNTSSTWTQLTPGTAYP
jgi:hypothetical protein